MHNSFINTRFFKILWLILQMLLLSEQQQEVQHLWQAQAVWQKLIVEYVLVNNHSDSQARFHLWQLL